MEQGKGVNTNVCDTVCVQVQNIDNQWIPTASVDTFNSIVSRLSVSCSKSVGTAPLSLQVNSLVPTTAQEIKKNTFQLTIYSQVHMYMYIFASVHVPHTQYMCHIYIVITCTYTHVHKYMYMYNIHVHSTCAPHIHSTCIHVHVLVRKSVQ